MAYACPVCGAPQADGEHLGDHLALTAVLHGDDHEAWLDEHAPDWEGKSPDTLGAAVVEHAEETAHEAGADEPVEGHEDVRHRDIDLGELDPETRRVVERAREMVRSRLGSGDGEE